jgi:hypothetical protein
MLPACKARRAEELLPKTARPIVGKECLQLARTV